ncbi:MAG: hypothetical protein HY000_42110 [Planctomycetes bacterium]|nr:hypothetical protein [Planctomycetota bacterium]
MDAPSKEQAAQQLAARHYAVETGITRIFRLNSPAEVESKPTEPIRLLEVSTTTPSTGIMPLGFRLAPSNGVAFPSVIIEVSPEEFERIKSHDLRLPDGWTIGDELPRMLSTSNGSGEGREQS